MLWQKGVPEWNGTGVAIFAFGKRFLVRNVSVSCSCLSLCRFVAVAAVSKGIFPAAFMSFITVCSGAASSCPTRLEPQGQSGVAESGWHPLHSIVRYFRCAVLFSATLVPRRVPPRSLVCVCVCVSVSTALDLSHNVASILLVVVVCVIA